MGARAMSASRLARVAPTALRVSRSFQTTAPAKGAVSTIGTLGCVGIMGTAAKYDLVQQAIPKNEHQVLAWIGGMFVFGNMARMGGSKEEAPAGGTTSISTSSWPTLRRRRSEDVGQLQVLDSTWIDQPTVKHMPCQSHG